MVKKVLVPLAEGYEEMEALTIVDVLRRSGIEVITVALTDNLLVQSSHDVFIKADSTIEKEKNNNFDAIVLPGGKVGMLNLKNDKRIIDVIQRMHKDKKLVAAVCASPVVLGDAGVLNKYTCYPSMESEIKIGQYDEASLVVVDNNVITSKGPATTILFAFAIVQYLVGKEKAEEVKKAMLLHLVIK